MKIKDMVKKTIASNIKKARINSGMTQAEAAEKLGITAQAISNFERGINGIENSLLLQMCEIYHTSMGKILGEEHTDTQKIPRVGRIACGDPITAEENIECYDDAPAGWHADFSLLCVGDSMSPKIEDGDIVAIRCQQQVHDGEIAAVRIGDEATLKMVFLHQDYVELRPVNPAYPSIIRRMEEMEEIRIEGKAVGLCRNL